MDNDKRFHFYSGRFCVPNYMRESVLNYIEHGIPVGDFLTAIICNNLKESYLCADENNLLNIPAYVNFFYNHAPSTCWGSKEKMDAWIKQKQEERNEELANSEKRPGNEGSESSG
uniref:Uncharacterized protein n=1 Tax=viral metagenome TaxID=1070528 RepID=A0A6M3K816_9ZZZZ